MWPVPLAAEFRDGNVPAGREMLRILKESPAALPGPLNAKRLKAIRFALIDAPARLVEHSRRLYIRLARDNPALELLVQIRRLIRNLAPCPALAADDCRPEPIDPTDTTRSRPLGERDDSHTTIPAPALHTVEDRGDTDRLTPGHPPCDHACARATSAEFFRYRVGSSV